MKKRFTEEQIVRILKEAEAEPPRFQRRLIGLSHAASA